MPTDPRPFRIAPDRSIREAVERMVANRCGIVLVVDREDRLIGTVTDGDVRRAMLANMDMTQPVRSLLERKIGPYVRPITAPADADRATLVGLLQEYGILHLPLVDAEGRVVGLATADEFLPEQTGMLQAVVMAGGPGTRLRPLTEETPKPMLAVGGRPLLEIIIEQLREAGIRRVSVTTHHRAEKISNHFRDGRDFGVEITYLEEDEPLGTAGALGLMEPPTETLLVINGDILTEVGIQAMLTYHQECRADLTVGVRRYAVQVPFGVVETDGPQVTRLTEKPELQFLVNAGIYLIEPEAHRYIPVRTPFDMTDLIQRLLDAGRLVASFPIHEYWLDIGQHEDYQRAQHDVRGFKRQA